MTSTSKSPTLILCSQDHRKFQKWIAAYPQLKTLDCRQTDKLASHCEAESVILVYLSHYPTQEAAIAAIKAIQQHNLKMIAITDQPTVQEGQELFKAGIKGYLAADFPAGQLQQVIDVVQQGNIWLGQNIMAALIEKMQTPVSDDHWQQGLTAREIETAQAILQGLSNKQIAEQFFISERTVKSHVHNLLEKFNVKDRLALVLKIQAIRHPN